jgi:hypothetical protein
MADGWTEDTTASTDYTDGWQPGTSETDDTGGGNPHTASTPSSWLVSGLIG